VPTTATASPGNDRPVCERPPRSPWNDLCNRSWTSNRIPTSSVRGMMRPLPPNRCRRPAPARPSQNRNRMLRPDCCPPGNDRPLHPKTRKRCRLRRPAKWIRRSFMHSSTIARPRRSSPMPVEFFRNSGRGILWNPPYRTRWTFKPRDSRSRWMLGRIPPGQRHFWKH
jgi:hypothetical protein